MIYRFKGAIDSPCLRCELREVGCHSVCERYAEYKRANEEMKEKRRKRCAESVLVTSYVHDSILEKRRGKR